MIMACCRRLSEFIVLLTVALSCLWQTVESDYYPVYGRGSSVFYNASTDSHRYPDVQHVVTDSYEYFLSDLDFGIVSGKIVCGAADKVYMLHSENLTEAAAFLWESDTSKREACEVQNSDTQSYTCRNHIRVHRPIPTITDSTTLLVCGTQATKTPQCRVMEVEGEGGSLTGSTAVDTSSGIVSYYPGFSQFGEFRNENDTDTTYFSAGFFEGNSGVGRHFSISYQAITVSDSPEANSLTIAERFRTISANNNWLRYPVTFVDYLRLDYEMPAGGHESDFQFYFAFIRENLYSATTSSDDIIQSRVVRICRNDPGYTPTEMESNNMPYFTTYMKARIFCERQLESADQFNGAIKYFYNELRSVAFTEGGRFSVGGNYGKKLYGAFSGPVVGPHGTAICVYNAENTEAPFVSGRSQSMFDIFREDLVAPDGDLVENSFVACDPAGRSVDNAQNILINEDKSVAQIGSDPLLVMDGLLINQMVLDQQCVVKKDDRSSCSNQDILFLGTDTGKVKKVVFASGATNVFPVIVEEISLDDGNNIEKMVIRDNGGGDRHLFVNTNSKIYKFPLARCSRHESCTDCVASRDPYCMWDGDTKLCVSNPFQADQHGDTTFNSSRYKQNIHSGEGDTSECIAKPHCDLITSTLTYDVIQVEASCTNTDQISVSVAGLTVASPTINLDSSGRGSTVVSGSSGLQSYTVQVTAEGIVFSSVVTTPPGPPLTISSEEVLVDSITATSFRVTLNINQFTDHFTEYSFKIEGSFTMTDYQLLSASTSYDVTRLTPATDYVYTVVLRNSVGMVTTQEFTTRTLDDIPSAVRQLQAVPVGPRSVALSWNDPVITNGDIVGYTVSVGESGGESREVRGCGGWGKSLTTSYTVTGLTPFTQYQFEVAACTSAGKGDSGSSVVATTNCSAPGLVTDLQLTTTNASTLGYSWRSPATVNGNESALEYKVLTTCYDERDGGSPTVAQGTSSSGRLTNLSPLTLCCVRVTAINNCDKEISGPTTEACGETSDVTPEAVRNLVVEGVNQEGILVTWNPPANYERSGLEYRIVISAPKFSTVDTTTNDQGYFYLGSLNASKAFTVTVSARNSEGVGPALEANGTTLPPSPPPPTNPRLSIVDSSVVTLNFSWSYDDVVLYQVTRYVAVLRCNEGEEESKMTEEMSVTFDVTDPGTNFAWCTAQVQAENEDVGRGQFSALASIALPSTAPSKPRCYLVDDQGSSISISFDVTHPFSLDSLKIRYIITADFETESPEIEKNFTSLGNVLPLSVSRNTNYDFKLRLCNTHGCSEYCDQLRNFTTSSIAPRPPSEISVTDTSYNSVSLSWSVPEMENASAISYIIHLTSSGSGVGDRTLPGTVTNTTFTELDAQTMYSVAIQVKDTVTGTVGVFGPVKSFTTSIGTPSAPVALEASWKATQSLLTVSWLMPKTTNGTITRYEILYSGSIKEDCDKPEGEVVRNDSLLASDRSFQTMNTSNIQGKSIFVCVRAYTNRPGAWASFIITDINTGGLGSNTEKSSDRSGLIAVAVVATVAILSTVAATVLLCVVVSRNNNQVTDNTADQSSEEGRFPRKSPAPSGQSNDTGYDDRPQLHHLISTDSTASNMTLKPLIGNGTTHTS